MPHFPVASVLALAKCRELCRRIINFLAVVAISSRRNFAYKCHQASANAHAVGVVSAAGRKYNAARGRRRDEIVAFIWARFLSRRAVTR